MEILFIIAIVTAILVVLSVFSLFFKGVFTLLPSSAQNAINSTLSTIAGFGQWLSLISFPFVGAYIGNWWSTTGAIAGLVFGIVCAVGLRSQFKADNVAEQLPAQISEVKTSGTSSTSNNGLTEYNAGLGMCAKHEYAAAAVHFRAAIAINPHPEYYALLGTMENILGDTAGAMQTWAEGIDVAPTDKESSAIYAIRALTKLEKLGDYTGAVMDYTQAIALLPAENAGYKSGYLGNRARALSAIKDFDNALRDYTEAHQLDPTSAEWIGERGAIKLGNRDFHGAIADFSRALESDPDCDKADWKDGISTAAGQINS